VSDDTKPLVTGMSNERPLRRLGAISSATMHSALYRKILGGSSDGASPGSRSFWLGSDGRSDKGPLLDAGRSESSKTRNSRSDCNETDIVVAVDYAMRARALHRYSAFGSIRLPAVRASRVRHELSF
jgi:hypothetical protein